MTIPGVTPGLVILIIGFAVWMLGYGIWRVALVVTGGLYGYLVGTTLFAPQNEGWAIVIGIVAAIVMGLLAYFLWSLIALVYGMVLGASMGGWVALMLEGRASGIAPGWLTVIGGILGLILAFLLKDQVIMLVTALSGAGTMLYASQAFLPESLRFLARPNSELAGFIVWISVGVIGYFIQSALFDSRVTNTYAGYSRDHGTRRPPRAA